MPTSQHLKRLPDNKRNKAIATTKGSTKKNKKKGTSRGYETFKHKGV
jgi:hypothetical protein